jgi:small subunit ribosomal protein S2
MKELLEAGVHFGHQVRRWNPKMKEFIFGERNGIYIIDLQKTQRMFKEAMKFLTGLTGEGTNKTILFVGTKRQAQDAIKEEALRCNQFYINQRWLGGLLTNFQTIQKSIKRYKEIESMQADGRIEQYAKKERLQIERERQALEKNLSGIKEMKKLPDAIFVIDTNKEEIAVKEANRLGIPVVAVVDTNCTPEGVNFVIPGNDDALRAVRLFASRIADSVLEGQQLAQQKEAEEAAIAAEQAKASGVTIEITPRQHRDRGERGERGGRGRDRDRNRGDRRGRGERGDRGERRAAPGQSTPAQSAPAPPSVAAAAAEPAPEIPAAAPAPDSTPQPAPAVEGAATPSQPVESPVESAAESA